MIPIILERKKLFEQVAEHLQAQILGGGLRPGDRLPPERDLQLRFGVGRPAIREALISLQKSGLVELSNGAPARVATPTAQGVLAGVNPAVRQMLASAQGHRHFQDVRLFFETGLARRAAAEANAEQLALLKAALDDNEAAIGLRELFIETDVAFHFVLAQMTGNPVFVALHDSMSGWLKQQRAMTLGAEGQDQTAFKAHRCIYEAIALQDPDGAESAMRTHLLQLQAAFWERDTALPNSTSSA